MALGRTALNLPDAPPDHRRPVSVVPGNAPVQLPTPFETATFRARPPARFRGEKR